MLFYLGLGALWLLLWLFYNFIHHAGNFALYSLNDAWQVFYLVFVNYIFFEFGLPLILRRRPVILLNILVGILLGTVQLAMLSIGLHAWNLLGIELHVYTQLRYTVLIPYNYLSQLIDATNYAAETGLASAIFFGVAKLVHYNVSLRQAAQQMLIEKQEAELNYLKSQTNPHFLFNTLNNIYALAREKNDLAPESILRLSKILRFMLYETTGAFITVEQELEIISDYIALEKLRYDESLQLNFQQEVEDPKQPLPPLLLIPLIENAFKHGISEASGRAFIAIQLSVNQQQLIFVVQNSAENADDAKPVKENIGLKNLRRQLALLYKDYELAVNRNEAEFIVTLKLNLASHV